MTQLFRVTFWDGFEYWLKGQTVEEIRERVKRTLPSRANDIRTIAPMRVTLAGGTRGGEWL